MLNHHLTAALSLVFLLSSCASAPVPTQTPTPLPPTATVTLTSIPTPTATLTPTATPTSTPVPMPEGWVDIVETREIGGRQVVFNADGQAATEIDGEFFPVDARGCYYPDLFNPELQKNDPKIMELLDKDHKRGFVSTKGAI